MDSLRIGFLLGLRQIQRASLWTTSLIIFVMMLTFLNLIAISGVLVGLVEGVEKAAYEQSLGDIIISPLDNEDRILNTPTVTRILESYPEITIYSTRFKAAASVEANYRERRDLRGERDIISATILGVDPKREQTMTGLADYVIEGEYFDNQSQGQLLLGAYYIDRYAEDFGDIFASLSNIYPGDKVRLTAGDVTKEFTVKGIVRSKRDEMSLNVYIPDLEFRRLFNRFDRNADQIVMKAVAGTDREELKANLAQTNIGSWGKLQTFEEAMPKFVNDIKETFSILGFFVGSIGLVVASISIFIIIFINALSRRRHIGILKAIGIRRRALELAYVIQAAFYAFIGSLIGLAIIYLFLVPYFANNPIDFPVSDGILVAELGETMLRFGILFVVTLIAGFVPAWMIARQNTLNAILGRH